MGFLDALIPGLAGLLGAGAVEPAASGILGTMGGAVPNAAANSSFGYMSGLGNIANMPSMAGALQPAIAATAPPSGLAGALGLGLQNLKSVGSGILNNAAPINNLMGAMHQGQQMMQPQGPQPAPMQRAPAQPPQPMSFNAKAPQAVGAAPQPGLMGGGGQGLAGMLGLNPMLLARLLGGGGM